MAWIWIGNSMLPNNTNYASTNRLCQCSPGTPDRGGKLDDSDNFVLILETLKLAFDSSGRNYGPSFTAPTSYWYLRWFNLEQLWEYADWINLMTYYL